MTPATSGCVKYHPILKFRQFFCRLGRLLLGRYGGRSIPIVDIGLHDFSYIAFESMTQCYPASVITIGPHCVPDGGMSTLAERYHPASGQPLAHVIAPIWVGGNIAHSAIERPRVLIDGNPRRAPRIDRGASQGVPRPRRLDRQRSRPGLPRPQMARRCSLRSRSPRGAPAPSSRSAGRSCLRCRHFSSGILLPGPLCRRWRRSGFR